MSVGAITDDDKDLKGLASRAAEAAGLPSFSAGPERRTRERQRAVARRIALRFLPVLIGKRRKMSLYFENAKPNPLFFF